MKSWRCSWEADLIRAVSYYGGPVESLQNPARQRFFEDRIEDWELNVLDGSGPGEQIRVSLVETINMRDSVSRRNSKVYTF